MSVIRTDAFAYSDGNLVTVSGGTWTDIKANPVTVVSGTVQEGASADACAIDNVHVYPNDQYVQAVFSGNNYPGLCWRMTAGSGGNGYVVYLSGVGGGDLKVEKMVNGTRSALTTFTITTGHTIKITMIGTAIEVFDNTVSVGTTTDGTFASGSAGVFIVQGGSSWIDTWESGDFISSISPGRLATAPTHSLFTARAGGATRF